MNRTGVRLVGLAALLALIAAACGGDADHRDAAPAPPTEVTPERPVAGEVPVRQQELVGTWYDEKERRLLEFGSNGTFAVDDRGLLDTTPAGAGTYELNGSTIELDLGAGSDVCKRSERQAWQASISEAEELHIVVVEASSGRCSFLIGTELTWTRVSPRSAAGAGITAEAPAGEGAPPSDESVVYGVWVLEDTGQLLRFGLDGTYAMDAVGALATDPDDEGTFDLDGKGTLTLTSGADSRSCTEGARWVWKKVQLAQRTLRGVVSADACRRALSSDLTWVMLSP